MLKWKILTGIGFAFGVAGILWGYAQEKKAPGFYELRVYTAQPGKRDALAEAFAAKTGGRGGGKPHMAERILGSSPHSCSSRKSIV